MSPGKIRIYSFFLLSLFLISFSPFPTTAHCSASFTNLIFGKQALTFTDQVLPEILEKWSIAKLTRYAHPQFYQITSHDEVKQLFFQFKRLGPLTKYHGANGEVVTASTPEGKKVPIGKYTAIADFTNGTATISLVIQKSSQQWHIISFIVDSEGLTAPVPSQQSAEGITTESSISTKAELKDAVQHILKADTIQKGHNVDKLFQLAEIYLNEGNESKTLSLLEQALQADEANFEKQLTFTKLLIKNQQQERAANILFNINKFTENYTLFNESSKLLTSLGTGPPSVVESNSDLTKDIEIMLIPVGSPQPQILEELRVALENELGITVSVTDKTIEHGKPDKKLSDKWISEIYNNIQHNLAPLQYKMLLSEINATGKRIQTMVQQSRLIRAYLKNFCDNGKLELKKFEQQLNILQNQGQYDVYRLSRTLREAFPFDESTTVKSYIGVSSQNLGSKDSNYLFGGSDGSYGVITYYNFTAAINNEPDNRTRLVKRLLKQALSTVNFTFDIPRCNTPLCARAYPHSIEEHDKKSGHLCELCKQRLNKYKAHHRNDNSAYEYDKLGWKYIQNAEWEKTIAVLERAVNSDRGYGYPYEKLAIAYFNNEQYELGVAAGKKAIEIFEKSEDSSSGNAYEVLGNNYYMLDQPDNAVTAYLKAAELIPVTEFTRIYLGNHFLFQRDYKTAIKHFIAAKELNKKNSEAYYGLGIAYSNIKQLSKAIESLETVKYDYLKNPEFHRLLGYCYDGQNKKKEAIEHYKISVELQPSLAQSYMDLARLYGQTGQLDISLASSWKALAIQPENGNIWNSLGYTYYLKKQFKKAIEHYTKALELMPENGLVHYNKALAHYGLEEFDDAIIHYDIAINMGYTGAWQFNAALQRYRHKKPLE